MREQTEAPRIICTVRATLPKGADGRTVVGAKPRKYRRGDERALSMDVDRRVLVHLQASGLLRGFVSDAEVQAYRQERAAAEAAAAAAKRGRSPVEDTDALEEDDASDG